MRTWAKASTPAALLAVAVMSFGGTALADTDGEHSIGGGNQADLPITLPIDISGNAVGVVGDSSASSKGGSSVADQGRGGNGNGNRTSGRSSVLGGTQANAPITAPINACGNAISVFGNSDSGCNGGATARTRDGSGGDKRTSGSRSILGGTQADAPISAPINACGNAISVFGDATAGCKGGTEARSTGSRGGGGKTTSGRGSVLGGTQADAPITAPANICGNSVALLGDAFSGCAGGAKATRDSGPRKSRSLHRGSTGHDTDGRFGAGSGNQVVAPIVAPVNLCGNAVGNATAGCKGGSSAHTKGGSDAGGNRTSGRSSVAGGNQVLAPITAPVNVCGNTIGAAGRAFAGCAGGLSVKNRGQAPGGNRTSGHSGVGGGNQVFAPITAPVNACGNAAAALGDAAGGCLGGAHLGRPGPKKGYGHAHQSRRAHASGSSTIPPRPRHSDAHQMSGGLPIVGDVAGQLGLAQVPGLPGLPATAAKPSKPAKPAKPAKSSKGKHAKHAKPAKKHTAAAANPAADLVATTPLGGAVKSATSSLPIGLMSAAQPAGVTGMSNASLLALVLGGLFAVTASVFSVTRRFRPSGK